MKKYYFLFTALFLSFMVGAQNSYYVLPSVNAGQNPGNLNTDDENPGNASWTDVLTGPMTTDTWSSAQTIPFTFEFGGSTVSSFYVSNTGVVTFNSSPGTPPSSANVAMPSLAVPDQSIMAWGLTLTGSNDAIKTKVFGSSPNRQLWIQYNSASAPEMSGANEWAYWAIVLEETTNDVYVVEQRTFATNGDVALTVGVKVGPSDFTQLPASPNVNGTTNATSGNGSDPSDNTYYQFIYGTQAPLDVAGVSLDMPSLVKTNQQHTVGAVFRNLGSNSVTSADINYKINGGATVTASVSNGLPMAPGASVPLSSPNRWTPSSDGQYTVEVWLSNVNGSADGNPSNDKVNSSVGSVANPPVKRAVIEERTGTWCGWCPRGTVAMEYMGLTHHNEATLIAVHNADPMALSSYDPNLAGAFPTFVADRNISGIGISGSPSSAGNMVSIMNELNSEIPKASVNITNMNYNSSTGSISVDIESDFFVDEQNTDYRYVMVITENGIKGTSPGYAQVNYYAGGGNGSMTTTSGFDFANAPDPVPASQMVYDHVAMDIVPNYDGNAGDVPANLTFGQKVTHNITTTLPASSQNDNHVYINVILVDANDNGKAVNSNHKKLTNTVGLDEADALEANVYPNPADDILKVELFENSNFTVELINAVGQRVMVKEYTEQDRAEINTSELKAGVYVLHLTSGESKSTVNVVVTH